MAVVLFDEAWLERTALTALDFAKPSSTKVSTDDDLFSARGAWRDAHPPDRVGMEGLARSVHRGLARFALADRRG